MSAETKHFDRKDRLSWLSLIYKYRWSYGLYWTAMAVLGAIPKRIDHLEFIAGPVLLLLFFWSAIPYFKKEIGFIRVQLLSTILPFCILLCSNFLMHRYIDKT